MKFTKKAIQEVKTKVRLVKHTRKDDCRFYVRIGSNWYGCWSLNTPTATALKKCLG